MPGQLGEDSYDDEVLDDVSGRGDGGSLKAVSSTA
jgi:hypothetical protein